MMIVRQFNTATDFWSEMVEPDYNEYLQAPADLRRAWHAAISLFHMSDWVFETHKNQVQSSFTFQDGRGNVSPASTSETFANALEQQCPDFGRIRGIANAAKHFKLRPSGIRPVQNAPRNAANTFVQVLGFLGQFFLDQSPIGGSVEVMLAGPNGNDMKFSRIAKNVYDMWVSQKAVHGW